MDGTGKLFSALTPHLDPALRPRVVAYPVDRPRTYDELLAEIRIPSGPFAIVAESFSGPVGIRLAATYPSRVHALVLAATFLECPSKSARWVHLCLGRELFRRTPPNLGLRAGLLGMDAAERDLRDLRAAIELVAPEVMSARLGAVVDVDVRREFAQLSMPILYIGGSRDRLVGADCREVMKRLRGQMETRVLDAPHLVLQRRPQESALLISEFVLRAPVGRHMSR
jgi:pimeloyl-ACP methyl ester carboxylesterase